MEGSPGDNEWKPSHKKQHELPLSVLSAMDELLASEPMASSKWTEIHGQDGFDLLRATVPGNHN